MSILSRGLKPILEMKILMICEKYDFFRKMTVLFVVIFQLW